MGSGVGRRLKSEEDICLLKFDSHCCTAVTNTTATIILNQNKVKINPKDKDLVKAWNTGTQNAGGPRNKLWHSPKEAVTPNHCRLYRGVSLTQRPRRIWQTVQCTLPPITLPAQMANELHILPYPNKSEQRFYKSVQAKSEPGRDEDHACPESEGRRPPSYCLCNPFIPLVTISLILRANITQSLLSVSWISCILFIQKNSLIGQSPVLWIITFLVC